MKWKIEKKVNSEELGDFYRSPIIVNGSQLKNVMVGSPCSVNGGDNRYV
jgi:hypothetical protein